ncbi:phosphonate C-P lyase system protein PhnH [Rhodobacter maris]|uniref:Alpha-D-ribose 1-methylphosphonate 5-triphosphate synthase subunit PhnH n=1 Tax=Rhodobacter maris TaxID=446682 RepID=A0A285S851_9RHOB|nr:phosphonate C-P lyase system protein PhnH [Rhodobacter maris]SOC03371.1 alpha-D-ribose 1-methylphosphonate 5-triphosphate synthase subunit PhnH [Rhodobacter maris]
MEDPLSGGFADAPVQAARAFRAALEAMARPGRMQRLAGATPPAPLSVAAGTLLLTLVDDTTPLYLAPGHQGAALRDWIAFHCAAPLCAPEEAVFALGRWEGLPLERFRLGTPEYPDRSVTLIVEPPALAPQNAQLSGPGIATVQAAQLPETAAFEANRARFPLGFDAFFCAGDQAFALPRSTRVEAL